MLTKEQNELLTQVGSSTPMGELMRQYWIPFYLSNDLEADGPPQRVRLLGEDLIVFRATSGQVGLVGNHCPHRGASLFFARNEEEGLRCVYHGWKYDVSGACVDMPNEPPESNFKHKIQHTAYPVQERNGILWTYMGQSADLPELPNFEWNSVPTDQVHYSIRIADNNFMQPIEGEYDTTHIGFLHQGNQNEQADLSFIESVLRPQGKYEKGWTWNEIGRRYKAPRWETADTDYGVLVGSRRDLENGESYWRIYPFAMPFHTLIPGGGPEPMWSGHAWVPMDDEHTICLCWTFHALRPLTEKEVKNLERPANGLEALHASRDIYHPPSAKPYGQYWPKWDNANSFNFDYSAQQRGVRFSGLPGTWPQDSGMQQSMGFVYDRTKEHLGTSDSGQIQIRRRLTNAAIALREAGTPPPGVTTPDAYYMRPISTILPNTSPWVDSIKEMQVAGVPLHPAILNNRMR
jgi:phenylpropionate dioxygenase-like ring-hydroxylating dioxygenase large terminal subunit